MLQQANVGKIKNRSRKYTETHSGTEARASGSFDSRSWRESAGSDYVPGTDLNVSRPQTMAELLAEGSASRQRDSATGGTRVQLGEGTPARSCDARLGSLSQTLSFPRARNGRRGTGDEGQEMSRPTTAAQENAKLQLLGQSASELQDEYQSVIDGYGGDISKVPQNLRDYYEKQLTGRKAAEKQAEQNAAQGTDKLKKLFVANDDGDDVHVNFGQRVGAIGKAVGTSVAGGYAGSAAVLSDVMAPKTAEEHADVQTVNYERQRIEEERQAYIEELEREGRAVSEDDPGLKWYDQQLADMDEAIQNTTAAAQKSVDNQAKARQNLRDFSADMAEKNAEARETALEDASTVGGLLVNASIAAGEMASDALVKAATGSGMAPMLVRVFGNTATEVAQKGGSLDQQLYEGARSAAVEYITEKLFDANPVYDGGDGIVTNWIYLIADKFGASDIVKNALSSLPASMLQEGLEEVLSDVFNPLIDRYAQYKGADYDLDTDIPDWETMLEDGIIGALLGGMGKAGEAAIGKARGTAQASGGNTRLSDADLQEYLSVGERQHVRNSKLQQLDGGQSPILTTVDQIKSFIKDCVSGQVKNTIKSYGRVGENLANDVYTASDGMVDISGYYLEIASNQIRHLSKHGAAESDIRNIPLTAEQLESIPDYIDNYDDIIDVVRRKDGSVRIMFGKKINGHSIIIEAVSKGRQSIHPVTAYQIDTAQYEENYGTKARVRATTSQRATPEDNGYEADTRASNNIPNSGKIVNGGQAISNVELLSSMATRKLINQRAHEFADKMTAQTRAAQEAQDGVFAAEQGQKMDADNDLPSSYIDNSTEPHTPEQQKRIREFKSSVDDSIVAFVNKVRGLVNPRFRSRIIHTISPVSDFQAAKVAGLTGTDVSEFNNIIDGDAVDHIDNRHGENGEADHSMADINDLGRIGYVLENFDDAVLLTEEDGETPKLSHKWKNSDNSRAVLVQFQKRIDGTMYVVEAVPDTNKKSLAVVSAYMQKNNSGNGIPVLNMPQSGPQLTPETPQGASSVSTNSIIPNSGRIVNDGQAISNVEMLSNMATRKLLNQRAHEFADKMTAQRQSGEGDIHTGINGTQDVISQNGQPMSNVELLAEILARDTEQIGDSSAKLEKQQSDGIIRDITISDFEAANSLALVSQESLEEINRAVTKCNVPYDEVKILNIGREQIGMPIFRTAIQPHGTWCQTTLEINATTIGGKTVDGINLMLRNSQKGNHSVVGNIEEAIIHESIHAWLAYERNFAQYEALGETLADVHIDGISKTAMQNGEECLCETAVLLARGEEVPQQAMELWEKYFGGGR